MLGRFKKQPVEVVDFDIDFSKFLADGDSIVTAGNPPIPVSLTKTVDPAGLTLGATFVREGTILKQWISGGTDGTAYKVTLTVTTGAGRVKQVEFLVRVRDE